MIMYLNITVFIKYIIKISRLLFGGYYPIGVISIRLIQESKNFEYIIILLCALDSLTSDAQQIPYWKFMEKLEAEHIDILVDLTEDVGNGEKEKKYDDYIYQTFHYFIKHGL